MSAFGWGGLVASACLLFPLLVPVGSAQADGYSMSFTVPAVFVNIGNGVTATVTVLKDGAPVANAQVNVTGFTSAITNSQGQQFYGLYNGDQAGTRALTAHLWRAYDDQAHAYAYPAVPDQVLTMAWTRVNLTVAGPSGTVEPGNPATFTATATWIHDGSPIPNVRVHFMMDAAETHATTGADGTTSATATRSSEGIVWANVTIDPADRPNGIQSTYPPPASAVFKETASPSGGGGGGGGGGGSSPTPSPGVSDSPGDVDGSGSASSFQEDPVPADGDPEEVAGGGDTGATAAELGTPTRSPGIGSFLACAALLAGVVIRRRAR